MPKIRTLFIGASFDPGTLGTVCKAFDAAWGHVAPGVSTSSDGIEAARTKLANIILGLASEGARRDVEALTKAALDLMSEPPRGQDGLRSAATMVEKMRGSADDITL